MSGLVEVRVKRLHGDAKLPAFMHPGDACADLYSVEDVTIQPGEVLAVGTGIAVGVPPGFELVIRPRSGLALRQGVSVLNSPGTVDSGYRGEVRVILINQGTSPAVLKRGDRIAQAGVRQVPPVRFVEVTGLDETGRGGQGFGSTGGFT